MMENELNSFDRFHSFHFSTDWTKELTDLNSTQPKKMYFDKIIDQMISKLPQQETC